MDKKTGYTKAPKGFMENSPEQKNVMAGMRISMPPSMKRAMRKATPEVAAAKKKVKPAAPAKGKKTRPA